MAQVCQKNRCSEEIDPIPIMIDPIPIMIDPIPIRIDPIPIMIDPIPLQSNNETPFQCLQCLRFLVASLSLRYRLFGRCVFSARLLRSFWIVLGFGFLGSRALFFGEKASGSDPHSARDPDPPRARDVDPMSSAESSSAFTGSTGCRRAAFPYLWHDCATDTDERLDVRIGLVVCS